MLGAGESFFQYVKSVLRNALLFSYSFFFFLFLFFSAEACKAIAKAEQNMINLKEKEMKGTFFLSLSLLLHNPVSAV